jgi:hypothetical protein
MTRRRHNKKWNINEELALQREYELLEWTVKQIASKHERSDTSILFKLQKEGFIENWNSARGFNKCNIDTDYFNEKEDESNTFNKLQTQTQNHQYFVNDNELSDRVEMLEQSLFEFKIILTKILNETTQLKTQYNFQHLEL